MSRVSVDHTPLKRSKLLVEKRSTDTNPGEMKDPLCSDELNRFVNETKSTQQSMYMEC